MVEIETDLAHQRQGKMTKRKPPDQLQKRGRKSTFDKRFIDVAKRMAYLGATDEDLAIAFGVTMKCVIEWRAKHPQFGEALKLGKKEADQRVERSLYQKAVGYSYDAVKIFMPAGAKKPVIVPYREHVPPSDVACIFWLKNRDPAHWRDAWQIEASVGKYLISDKPMTAAQWIAERATVVDAEPVAIEDKSEEPC
jgi:hypothetical protein